MQATIDREVTSDSGLKPLPVFISAEASERVLTWQDMITHLAAAYGVGHDHQAHPRRVVTRGTNGTWLRTLPAAPSHSRFMGAKLFGGGRKQAHYMIALFDQKTGALAGLLDANYITACRTGATSALAVDRLARRSPAILSLLGSGSEAKSHARAIAHVRPLSEIRVFSTNSDRCASFAAGLQQELRLPCRAAASAEAAVRGSDIVVAPARSHGEKPILFGSWLQPGMVVVSIGSTIAEQREIDTSVVDACDLIVCDTLEEVVEETGDMLAAVSAGCAFDHKLLSLSDLIMGRAQARVDGARLPMFKSVGAAVQDIAIAELALEKACAAGLAVPLPIEFSTKHF